MKSLRDSIAEATGFYYRKVSFREIFQDLARDGKFDHLVKTKILAAICDWIEKFEEKLTRIERAINRQFKAQAKKPIKKTPKKTSTKAKPKKRKKRVVKKKK